MKNYPRIPPDDERCSKPNVVDDTGWHSSRCSRRGVVKEGDQLWCKQHAPSSVKARDEASTARYKAEWERRDAPSRKIEHLEAINADLLAALERLAPEPEPTRFESSRRCRFCGSDRRTHNDDCAWVQARAAIDKAKLPA